MADEKEKGTNPNWNEEAKSAFNDFKKRKRSLPSPPDANQTKDLNKKIKKGDVRNFCANAQSIVNRTELFNKNRVFSDELNEARDESRIRQNRSVMR